MKRSLNSVVVWGAIAVSMSVAAQTESVLVQHDGIAVSATDIDYYMQENIPEDRRGDFTATDKALLDVVENLYLVRALAEEAESLELVDPKMAAWSAEMKFKRELVEQYRNALLSERLGNVDWDALALETYKAEPDKFMSPERISASHILVRDRGAGDDETRRLAEQLRDRALAGEEFAELAKANTDDPAGRQNGGDLGFFARGQMVPEFEAVAFALEKPGDISEVVKTPFGYHVIQLHQRQPAEKIPFARVKDNIVKDLSAKMGNRVWQDKVVSMRTRLRPHIDDAKLEQYIQAYKSNQSVE